MKITLPHESSAIRAVLQSTPGITIYFNKNGIITECKGIFYNNVDIKMVPRNFGSPVLLESADEIYYNQE